MIITNFEGKLLYNLYLNYWCKCKTYTFTLIQSFSFPIDQEFQFRNTHGIKRYLLKTSNNNLLPLIHAEETLMPMVDNNMLYVLKYGK